jgi:putative hemolysin
MINIWFVVLFVLCLLLAAFFCSAETSFISIQKLRLQHLVRTRRPGAKTVAKILERPEKFLATVLLGINFFETAVATLGTVIAINLWDKNPNLATLLATIVITILTLVLAELIPKSLAARYRERLALIYARPIEFIGIIFYPFVYILSFIGIRFTRRISEETGTKPTLSEEEFRTAIDVGEAEGVVEEEAAEMLHNVFEFGNRPVREVMVPRPEVVSIEKNSKLSDFLQIYARSPLSRFPVFEDNMDNVVGILSVKDVLMAMAKDAIGNDSVIDNLVRPAYFTPETKQISELFIEMKDNNYRMAIVIDEFGGTAGIVSLTQLVEEIVGPVGNEMALTEKEYEVIDEHTFQIDGSMRVDEVNDEMQLGIPEGDYETVAGFVLHLLGRIPTQGEHVKYRGLKILITRMHGVKIEEILVTREIHLGELGEKDVSAAD